MCWCDIVSKAKIGGLKHLGTGMESSLRFLAEIILGLSIIRVLVNWSFGIYISQYNTIILKGA